MPKVVYEVSVQYPAKPVEVVGNLETITEASEAQIADRYLNLLEATLEKIETGKRGVIRIGSRVFPVSDDNLPQLGITIRSVIQDPSDDGLHNPTG
jgi:hypothetical protein